MIRSVSQVTSHENQIGFGFFCDTTANPLDNALPSRAESSSERQFVDHTGNLGAILPAGTGSIGMRSTRGYPEPYRTTEFPPKPLRDELVGLISNIFIPYVLSLTNSTFTLNTISAAMTFHSYRVSACLSSKH
jgi:hypothetical protein